MPWKINLSALITVFSIMFLSVQGQKFSYTESRGPQGFSISEQTSNELVINFIITEFELTETNLKGESHKHVHLPGHFLPNTEGAPDLPGSSRYILVPEGASVEMHIIRSLADTLRGINVMPAPNIPLDSKNQPVIYHKDSTIYHRNAYYPESPVLLKKDLKIRGSSVALLGIMPFQYNPISKELVIYHDLQVRLSFSGSTGSYGNEKYRDRLWDGILKNHLINAVSLPEVDYSHRNAPGGRSTGCEYLIICPNDTVFQRWADSIKTFRTEQGILTKVYTISEVGGNSESAIETFIDDAFTNWDIPPSAVLLLGDHGTDPDNSITSVVLNNHPDSDYNPYVSDNVYADVDGDQLPDIAFARITARNSTELEIMVHKFMNHERNPPTNPDYYDHPITALGWQTTRWFQICSESIGGFMKNELGKNPVRINAVYDGDPDVDPWSTAYNTTTVLNYFGPSGQGYIPSSPSDLGGWTGGNATQINNAINSGSFLLQHRDHGYYGGWGEPAYYTSNINSLMNTDLTFVMSINCQTGQFDRSGETFTEKFHRYQYNGNPSGALGLIAATQVSYSFVNDAYTWGVYDYMWPDFMPTYGDSPPAGSLLPCFGNVAGKYHLQQSTWPGSPTYIKEITYRLFHHHGDAYMTLYSEVPQALTVSHASFIQPTQTSFTVTADAGAFIALTSEGEILGTATANGAPLDVPILGSLLPNSEMVVTITKTNYYRYRSTVSISSTPGPYIVLNDVAINDAVWNNNSQLDGGETVFLTISLENIGSGDANNVTAELSSSDTLVQITDSSASFGNLPPGDISTAVDGYQLSFSEHATDGHEIWFEVSATDGSSVWTEYFSIEGHVPVLEMAETQIDDSAGNGNNILDPGETVDFFITIGNSGSTEAEQCTVALWTNDPYLQVIEPNAALGNIVPAGSASEGLLVSADPSSPSGYTATLHIIVSADNCISKEDSVMISIGKVSALVLDLDPNTSSGPDVISAMQANGLTPDYTNTFPDDLSKYQSVFCCLGIYPTNYVLDNPEGDILSMYLNNGGRLYMEGGDTWAWDPQTSAQAMFNISGDNDGGADMETVSGLAGVFTEGQSYSYTGENNWMDRLSAVSPAFPILENESPQYHTCVAYDAGSYATIGASHEFGGLVDGNNSKAELMAGYLMFFGIPVTCIWEGVTDEWNNPVNWSNGMVPDHSTNVIIPLIPGNTYPFQFSEGEAHCKDLKVEPGVTLTVPSGVDLIIHQ
jgi:hypothetical protein